MEEGEGEAGGKTGDQLRESMKHLEARKACNVGQARDWLIINAIIVVCRRQACINYCGAIGKARDWLRKPKQQQLTPKMKLQISE